MYAVWFNYTALKGVFMLNIELRQCLQDIIDQLDKLSHGLYEGEDWSKHAEAERILSKIKELIPSEDTNDYSN